jgi:biopolymer transport protein TolR
VADVRPSGSGLKAEINVTPLVDVVLVLLIIFMVVTPLLTRGRNVQLPLASAVDAERQLPDALVLTISADKRLFLDHRPIARDALAAELGRSIAVRGRSVLIKADASVTVRDLRPLLREIKAQRIHQIGFAVLDARGAK